MEQNRRLQFKFSQNRLPIVVVVKNQAQTTRSIKPNSLPNPELLRTNSSPVDYVPTAQNRLVKPRCTQTTASLGASTPKGPGHVQITRELSRLNCHKQLETPSPQRLGHTPVIRQLSDLNYQGQLETYYPGKPNHALILKRLSGLVHQKKWT